MFTLGYARNFVAGGTREAYRPRLCRYWRPQESRGRTMSSQPPEPKSSTEAGNATAAVPSLALTYLDIPGLAEPIRLVRAHLHH